jgi:phosphoenolpyruvate carboxykinase (GTP)
MDRSRRTAFHECGITDDGDICGRGRPLFPSHTIDWQGRDWTPASKDSTAHPTARFTAPARQCPIISPDWEKLEGVPIDIFIFGGRRASTVPLVYEAFGWDHGVLMGATASSETTAANIGSIGNVRRDPFAMKPFCGYNMGEYFQHWLDMGKRLGDKAPRIFYTNWFRKTADGRWLWPGFGENSRVLKWMCERVDGKAGARETAIGYMPSAEDLDLTGLNVPAEDMKELLRVDADAWKEEVGDMEKHFAQFGDRLPRVLAEELKGLAKRLES